MLEQIIETTSWKVAQGLIDDRRFRVCFEQTETLDYLVTGCKVLVNSKYSSRHNRTLMMLAVVLAKEHDLVGQDAVRSGGSKEQSQRREMPN